MGWKILAVSIIAFLIIAGIFLFFVFGGDEVVSPVEETITEERVAKTVVKDWFIEKGYVDSFIIYGEDEDESNYYIDSLTSQFAAITFNVSKEDKEISCLIIQSREFCHESIDRVISERDGTPRIRKYSTPEELYKDFNSAIKDKDYVLLRNTLVGEAEERYQISSSFLIDSWEQKFGDFAYENYTPWPMESRFKFQSHSGETITFEQGFLTLVSETTGEKSETIQIIKFDDSWRIWED